VSRYDWTMNSSLCCDWSAYASVASEICVGGTNGYDFHGSVKGSLRVSNPLSKSLYLSIRCCLAVCDVKRKQQTAVATNGLFDAANCPKKVQDVKMSLQKPFSLYVNSLLHYVQ